MKQAMSFLTGLVLGGLVGAVIAILFAPYSGEELRHQMSDRATVLQEEVKLAAAERRAELEEQLAALRAPKNPAEM
jgi:gas vesicle protein